MRAFLIMTVALLLAAAGVLAKPPTEDPKHCEVCINVLNQIDGMLEGKAKKNKDAIEDAIDKYCDQKLASKDDKMCYYFQPIKKSISQPFSTGMAKAKVCQRLTKTNSEICMVRYPIKVDTSTVDYNTMRVKQLKQLLSERGVDCKGCLEKSDFVQQCINTQYLDE
ncbi:unnamed protein product [Chrysoparadoxa australica]